MIHVQTVPPIIPYLTYIHLRLGKYKRVRSTAYVKTFRWAWTADKRNSV